MTTGVGTRLGPYEIVGWLGAGGMGEVYRARDARLGRDVALKLIAAASTADPSRIRRFEQEARAAAQLAHPSILAVYDVGTHDGVPYIVSELLEGESLRSRLRNGPLPLRKALDIARNAADGLAAAHDKSIVHRDIKPDNLFITSDGRVKILDFGIAKLHDAIDEPGPSGLPTETSAGTVVGTAEYMSPEQVRGSAVDARSDIFSLGAVLYEMVTGKAPFTRATPAETMAAILNAEPPELDPVAVPTGIARVIARCLEKVREARYQSSRDLAFGLDVLTGTSAVRVPAPSGLRLRPALLALTVLASLAIAASGWIFGRQPAAPPDPLIDATFTRFTDWPGHEGAAEISPDGKFVSFVADKSGEFDQWVSQVGSGSFTNLTQSTPPLPPPGDVMRTTGFSADGSQVWMSMDIAERRRQFLVPFSGGSLRLFLAAGDLSPAWSPDGNRLAFVNGSGGDPLYVAGPMGVDPKAILKDSVGLHNHNPAWSPDGSWIYFAHGAEPSQGMDVWRVRPDGSGREQMTTLGTDVRMIAPLDARTVLFIARAPDLSGPWLWAVDTETKLARRVISGLERYTSVSASRDGRRIVATQVSAQPSLWMVPLAAPVADEADARPYPVNAINPFGPRFAGTSLFFLTERGGAANGLWRSDDGGEPVQVWSGMDGGLTEPPAVSRDGARVAIVLRGGRRRIVTIARDGTNPRTISGTLDVRGTPFQSTADWSPDGKWIVTGGDDGHGPGLFKIPADGGTPVRLATGRAGNPVWSPDGALIVYSGEVVEGRAELRAVRPDGTGVPLPSIGTRPGAFRFTPDSRTLIFLPILGAMNFHALDLVSKKTAPITRLVPRGTVLTFDVTSDGKYLVFERTVQNGNVVLIERPNPGGKAPGPAAR